VNNPAHRAGHQHQDPEEGAIHPRAQHGVFWQNCINITRGSGVGVDDGLTLKAVIFQNTPFRWEAWNFELAYLLRQFLGKRDSILINNKILVHKPDIFLFGQPCNNFLIPNLFTHYFIAFFQYKRGMAAPVITSGIAGGLRRAPKRGLWSISNLIPSVACQDTLAHECICVSALHSTPLC